MFVEQGLWLVNASARNQYNIPNNENNQRWMHKELAMTERLGEGLSEEEQALLVEEYLKQEVVKGDADA